MSKIKKELVELMTKKAELTLKKQDIDEKSLKLQKLKKELSTFDLDQQQYTQSQKVHMAYMLSCVMSWTMLDEENMSFGSEPALKLAFDNSEIDIIKMKIMDIILGI